MPLSPPSTISTTISGTTLLSDTCSGFSSGVSGLCFFVHWGLAFWNLESFIQTHMVWVLLIGALLGIVPESGPHLIFVMMYAEGLVPFSVLFTTSFVQDGHGMLPLLSYSLKDSALVKLLNLVFGVTVGGILFALGF